MAIHELTIGMYSRHPDAFADVDDNDTTRPHRISREDAEHDYTEANNYTDSTRAAQHSLSYWSEILTRGLVSSLHASKLECTQRCKHE